MRMQSTTIYDTRVWTAEKGLRIFLNELEVNILEFFWDRYPRGLKVMELRELVKEKGYLMDANSVNSTLYRMVTKGLVYAINLTQKPKYYAAAYSRSEFIQLAIARAVECLSTQFPREYLKVMEANSHLEKTGT